MSTSVLMVCVGNICRSPMAEAIWNQRHIDLSQPGLAQSAGLSARSGIPVDPIAARLLAERQIDASHLTSTPLRSAMLRDFELVLVMEHWQKARLEHIAPYARGRIYTLGHWNGTEIPDPYGEPEDTFRRSLTLIDDGINTWLQKLGR